MESERFDDIVRGISEGASRRGLARAGLGAFAAAALVALGLSVEEDIAAGKSRRASRRKRVKVQKKKKKKKKIQGPQGPPGPPGPATLPLTCTAERPHTCGVGCCPNEFPVCCDDVFDILGKSCNAAGAKCCSIEEGGGSCLPGFKCCPITRQNRFGFCTQESRVCCDSDHGGGSCPGGSQCCPNDAINAANQGCCPVGQACCDVDVPCATGTCVAGCCQP